MLQAATIKFLKGLQKNNNKPWFDKHREEYDTAKADFVAFVDELIQQHSKKDPTISDQVGKNCIFRINRDVRFSKDKQPYKRNFAASITEGGKKSPLAGYYFHLEPGGEVFVGGGVWQPEPEKLARIRQEIDYNLDDFKKIVESKKFKSTFGDLYTGEGMALSRVPKGFEADNPAAEYLKLKSYIAMLHIPDEELTSKGLSKKILQALDVLQPMNAFLNVAIR